MPKCKTDPCPNRCLIVFGCREPYNMVEFVAIRHDPTYYLSVGDIPLPASRSTHFPALPKDLGQCLIRTDVSGTTCPKTSGGYHPGDMSRSCAEVPGDKTPFLWLKIWLCDLGDCQNDFAMKANLPESGSSCAIPATGLQQANCQLRSIKCLSSWLKNVVMGAPVIGIVRVLLHSAFPTV